MKATGIVRKVDELGRVVLPKELRDVLDIKIKDPVEFYSEGEFILIRKYNPGCLICGGMGGVKRFKDRNICQNCIDSLINR
jgi:transcriptional pleiotropic regulator of transition state genes